MKAALIFALMLVASSTQAQNVELNKKFSAQAPLCRTFEAAEQVAKADEKGGVFAGAKALNESKDCAILNVTLTLKKIMASHPAPVDRMVHVVSADVFMEDGSKVEVFVITDASIKGVFETNAK